MVGAISGGSGMLCDVEQLSEGVEVLRDVGDADAKRMEAKKRDEGRGWAKRETSCSFFFFQTRL